MSMPITPQTLRSSLLSWLGLAMAAMSALAYFKLAGSDVPVHKRGFSGMMVLTAWLLPLIIGFVALDRNDDVSERRKNRAIVALFVVLGFAIKLSRHTEISWLPSPSEYQFFLILGLGSPILLALVATIRLIRP